MLPRAARRLETSLLLSRQALPRPARLYSSPSRPTNSPGLAAQQVLPQVPYPAFLNVKQTSRTETEEREQRRLTDLERFLVRDRTFTVLPPPPPATTVPEENAWFTDTSTQESMSIMDACLHNLYDVGRAKAIFSQLRKRETSSLLETGVYNAFIEAYFGMATHKEVENQDSWLGEVFDLYEILESGAEHVAPNKITYGLMLQAWMHYHRKSSTDFDAPSTRVNLPTPSQLLLNMHQRKISPSLVIAETVFDTHESATNAIKTLSQAAVNLNIPEVVVELGKAEAVTVSEDELQDVPEVMPVMREAKTDDDGNVIEDAAVPFNIAQLRRHLTDVSHTRRVLTEDAMSRQKHLEKSAYDVALERLQQQAMKLDSIGIANPALKATTLQKWMWEWHQKLRSRIEKEISQITKGEKARRPEAESTHEKLFNRDIKKMEALSPYLTLVKANRLSLITILEIMRLQGSGGLTDGMKTTRAVVSLGKAVEAEYKAQIAKKHQPSKDTATMNVSNDMASDPSSSDAAAVLASDSNGIYSEKGLNTLRARRLAAANRLKEAEGWCESWTQVTRAKIGGILVDCLMEVAEVERTTTCKKTGETIKEMQPAFYHSYEYYRGSKLGVIRLNPVVSERLAKDQLKDTLHPRQLPMLVKPQPWTSHNTGGYIYSKTPVMRYKDSNEQHIVLKKASEDGQFEHVYIGLDVLGSTPWKINRKVFDVVIQVWNSGERMGKVPPAAYDKPAPEEPENVATDMKARSVYMQRLRAYNQAKANNHSDRCSVNYKMEIARAFLNDTFYFPHNLDFRGRAYPVPAHLNHIGDDLCRGLLTFAETKPLGERGLRWLKIHIANLYGYDKANFDERVKWVDEHTEQIRETATNPLNGSKWWLSAGDPWQFLAASMELNAALESGNPYTFESNLPVHQDGTCNGLQHYAALGGDMKGAQQVNLVAGDKPSDVYSHVGRMVEEVIEKDVLKGEKYALMLQGKITRKVVKQTVMTTVYGVTYIGAREQIERQLKDRGDIEEEECWPAAAYLAHVVLGCIGNLFSGAKSIQTWLNLCARIISKAIPEQRIPELMAEYHGTKEQRQFAQIERAVAEQKRKEKADQLAEAAGLKRKTKLSIALENEAAAASEGEGEGEGQKIVKKAKMVKLKMPKARRVKPLPMDVLKKEQMTSVIWTTPLGLPIVQPYRKTVRKQIMTAIQTVYISDPNSMAEVNSVKQASAFPPNFIHSLDATHMMLTALGCRKKGLTFASVHDSYWTHASDIDTMSEVIRDTFISLHESNVLEELRSEFSRRYHNFKVPLMSLSNTSLAKKLYDAGSRIYATPEQASSLASLKDLVVVNEDVSTIDESRAVKDAGAVRELLNDLESADAKLFSSSADAEEDDGVIGMVGETYQAKAAREKKEQQKEAIVKLMGKFVNLSDLFPPLPQKGEFEVRKIKSSQYFFS
ncbi:hypothetical protein D9756_009879 [Leucocoprinus leucothites]|uniref:DNA-directed RNA polymerase n=1 Tax=Leucocoprinus leucothites TaxID=201217 RepID=A0A8H5CVD1_9AGAR|nr:hypothetical protein D9756_009879 [Leucoagaricus leucothites]